MMIVLFCFCFWKWPVTIKKTSKGVTTEYYFWKAWMCVRSLQFKCRRNLQWYSQTRTGSLPFGKVQSQSCPEIQSRNDWNIISPRVQIQFPGAQIQSQGPWGTWRARGRRSASCADMSREEVWMYGCMVWYAPHAWPHGPPMHPMPPVRIGYKAPLHQS